VSKPDERRRFPRLPLPVDAYGVDEAGVNLGRVTQAGGDGMLIHTDASHAERWQIGQTLRVTVVEPTNKVSNTIDVVVRYRHGNDVGVQFAERQD
jgi:PilZ domain-containing protein